jgi:hypothetical protein
MKWVSDWLERVPWDKYFLLWFLAIFMGSSLLWLHYGFTEKILFPLVLLAVITALGLLWGTTRPEWQKAHCAWCAGRVRAKATRFDKKLRTWILIYECSKCGHLTEKTRSGERI